VDVPPPDDPAWNDLVTGKVKHHLDFFAGKLLLGWLILKVESDPSSGMVQMCRRTLQNLFAQNAELPCVQHDLEKIFGEVPSDRHARDRCCGEEDS
jgi:hypothetical protein